MFILEGKKENVFSLSVAGLWSCPQTHRLSSGMEVRAEHTASSWNWGEMLISQCLMPLALLMCYVRVWTLPRVSRWDIAVSLLGYCLEDSYSISGKSQQFLWYNLTAIMQWESTMQRILPFSNWSRLTEIFSLIFVHGKPIDRADLCKKNLPHIHFHTLDTSHTHTYFRWSLRHLPTW